MRSNELCKLKRNIDWQKYLLYVSLHHSNKVIKLVHWWVCLDWNNLARSEWYWVSRRTMGPITVSSTCYSLVNLSDITNYSLMHGPGRIGTGNISNLNSNWTTLSELLAIMPATFFYYITWKSETWLQLPQSHQTFPDNYKFFFAKC